MVKPLIILHNHSFIQDSYQRLLKNIYHKNIHTFQLSSHQRTNISFVLSLILLLLFTYYFKVGDKNSDCFLCIAVGTALQISVLLMKLFNLTTCHSLTAFHAAFNLEGVCFLFESLAHFIDRLCFIFAFLRNKNIIEPDMLFSRTSIFFLIRWSIIHV